MNNRKFYFVTTLTAIVACFAVSQGISQDEASSDDDGPSLINSVRGAVLPVRSAKDPMAPPTRVSVETFRDEDFGTLTMITNTGSIASVPYPNSYDVRLARFDEGVQVIKFMPRLGTSWIMEEGVWRKIEEEKDDLFPGDYEIIMNATHDDDEIDVVRLERITGTTWMLGEDGWVEIADPDAE